MAVNSTGPSFNCTLQSDNSCSGDQVFECIDSIPGNVLTFSYLVINVILMLPLNCWILWLARRTMSVASSDFVFLNNSVAELINDISFIGFLLGATFGNKSLILFSNFLGSTFIVGRPLFQTCFCVERYLAVVHPLVYLKYTKSTGLKLPFVGVVWLTILIFGWFISDSCPKLPKWYCMGLFIPMLFVCTVCSVMILWVLKIPKPGEGEKEGAYQPKRKAFVAVTIILITLLFGYGTVACVIVLRDHLSYQTYCLVVSLGWWCLLPSSAVQPYLYLSKMDKLPCIKNL